MENETQLKKVAVLHASWVATEAMEDLLTGGVLTVDGFRRWSSLTHDLARLFPSGTVETEVRIQSPSSLTVTVTLNGVRATTTLTLS